MIETRSAEVHVGPTSSCGVTCAAQFSCTLILNNTTGSCIEK